MHALPEFLQEVLRDPMALAMVVRLRAAMAVGFRLSVVAVAEAWAALAVVTLLVE